MTDDDKKKDDDKAATAAAELKTKLKAAEKERDEYKGRIDAMDGKINELLDEKKAEQKKRQKAADTAARKDGDIEALDASWKKKFEAREAELLGQNGELKGHVDSLTRDSRAQTLANEMAIDGSAELLYPQLVKRIGVEIRDGKPTAVVLDEEGKPSASSFEDLRKEIAARPANQPIIVASKAAGGGASGSTKAGGAHSFKRGDLGGDKSDRVKALREKFPDLN